MTSRDLEPELQFALDLARRGADIAMALRGTIRLHVREKPDDEGPVTTADTRINELIVDAIEKRFPHDAILAEESAAQSGWAEASRAWHIDPVDGTREFADGDPSFAIHIGLAIEGRPVLGVVAEPAIPRLTWGIATASDRRGGIVGSDGRSEPLVRSKRSFDELLITTSKSHRSDRIDAVLRVLAIDPARNFSTGSVGVKVARIARGEADLYIHPTIGTKLWDTCAPEAILRAADGTMTDVFGVPIHYRGPEPANPHGVVASTGAYHDLVIAKIASLAAGWFPATAR